MLVLEIELLTGVYRAALPDGSGAEWPPHPERVFSALAQAWADGGSDPGERAALAWLERQRPPSIDGDGPEDWAERASPSVFVPPNDSRGDEIAVLPDRRRRQSRPFRAAIPVTPLVTFAWPQAVPSAADRAALIALARRVASLGHSSSLVRCAFIEGSLVKNDRTWEPAVEGRLPLRVPHPGRLDDLERWHKLGERPRAGVTARYQPPGFVEKPAPPHSVFGDGREWFVFEDAGGFRPDLLGFAQVAKRVRDSLMALGPQPVPELLSGHTTNGAATTNPHVAVVPLANVGWEHANGDLLGFAVVLPRATAASIRTDIMKALAVFSRIDRGEEGRAELRFGESGVWTLEHIATPVRSSLKPARWCATACTWASATPVLLDRFPEHGDVEEEAHLIASACRNIGLPEPVAIEIHKHPAVRGAPSAYPARGARRRPDWSFPPGAKFADRPRRHVVLRFTDAVAGPVILGAGRFHGLGLCLPLAPEPQP
jgi:CRISPR-associated protein Csb2